MIFLKNIKNIIFDFGGVLVGLSPEKSINAFKKLGIKNIEEYLTPYGHKGPFGEIENGDINATEFFNRLRKDFKIEATNKEITAAWASFISHTPINKMKMVHELAKNHRIFLLSNTNEIHIQKLQEFDDNGYPAKECFEKLYMSYKIGKSKPGKEIFEYVINDAKLKTEETLLIDDGPANCNTAKELGMQTYCPKPGEDIIKELIRPGKCIATMGFFDGVHEGHKYLIQSMIKEGKKRDLPSMVITFWPHPRKVLDTTYIPSLLTDIEEKEQLLKRTGADSVQTIQFTKELSKCTSEKFMKEILKDELDISCLIIGYDHHFGSDTEKTFEDYKSYGEKISIEVLKAGEFKNNKQTTSSSLIRRKLQKGEIEKANKALGRKYSITGKIIPGHKNGRKLGYPTANIDMGESPKLIPQSGVYHVEAEIENKRYTGMMNIGTRPTFNNGKETSLEVFIINFEGNLYGKQITIYFIEQFRKEKKFNTPKELSEQLAKDLEYIKNKKA